MVATRDMHLTENIGTIYSIVSGQCTTVLQRKLKSVKDYDEIVKKKDGIRLLLEIKNICYNFESQKHQVTAVADAHQRMHNT